MKTGGKGRGPGSIQARIRTLLCAVALACAAGAPAAAPELPVEAFFARRPLQDAQLSPSGKWLAVLSALPGRPVGFLIVDVAGVQSTRFIQASEDDDVSSFSWVSEDWLVFTVRDRRDFRNPRLSGGLMATRRDGSDSWQIVGRGSGASYMVGFGAPGSNEVILGYDRYDAAYQYMYTTLRALNVDTRQSRRLADDAPRADSWWFDSRGRPRVASKTDDDIVTTWWADAEGHWLEIDKSPFLQPRFTPAFVEANERLVVNTFDGKGDLELRYFDLQARRPGAQVLLTTPGFDTAVEPLREGGTGRLLGLHVLTDAQSTVWRTEAMQAIQAKVDARLPGRVNVLHCAECDAPKVVLVRSYSDVDPGGLLLYRPPLDKIEIVGDFRPEIDPQRMARMRFYRPPARDGRSIPLWITGAPGPGEKPKPAVVNVHGGPHIRGAEWGWDPSAQFLASRGYVVIEPEFRGSTGYGDEHFRAGWKQWGGTMIDDLTDALRFAVAQGWADPTRACIMGSSFGGYATLMSLVKEPDLYRCGIAHAAVSDPRHRFDFHWSDASRFVRKSFLPQVMGDPKTDAAMLEAASPLVHAARIKADVLLIHGFRDYRVPVENGERMRDALKKLGRNVEWVEYDEEGHGFSSQKNLLDFWRRIDVYLARHLQ